MTVTLITIIRTFHQSILELIKILAEFWDTLGKTLAFSHTQDDFFGLGAIVIRRFCEYYDQLFCRLLYFGMESIICIHCNMVRVCIVIESDDLAIRLYWFIRK